MILTPKTTLPGIIHYIFNINRHLNSTPQYLKQSEEDLTKIPINFVNDIVHRLVIRDPNNNT